MPLTIQQLADTLHELRLREQIEIEKQHELDSILESIGREQFRIGRKGSETIYAEVRFRPYEGKWYLAIRSEMCFSWDSYEEDVASNCMVSTIAEGPLDEIVKEFKDKYDLSAVLDFIKRREEKIRKYHRELMEITRKIHSLVDKIRKLEGRLRKLLADEIMKLPAPKNISEDEKLNAFMKVCFHEEWWEPCELLLFVGINKVEVDLGYADVDKETGEIVELPEELAELAVRLWHNRKKVPIRKYGFRPVGPIRIARHPTRYVKFVNEVKRKIDNPQVAELLLRWWNVAKHEFGRVRSVTLYQQTLKVEADYEYFVELPDGTVVTWYYNRGTEVVETYDAIWVKIYTVDGEEHSLYLTVKDGKLYLLEWFEKTFGSP